MTIMFRRAVRESVGLIIGLAGSSGSGKTYSAMRLASGIAGERPFAVIDTEGGRAKHYADKFAFDHADLHAPFTPEAYSEAIALADKEGYPVIVIDSFSHEWAGEGGVMDMQEEEFERMGHRDTMKMASWIKPKGRHKKMVQKLLQCRAHLILCMRAEEKIDMIKVDGKTKIVPKEGPAGFKGWLPICEKNLPYELIVSFLMMADNPGVGIPIKPLQDQLRPLFPEGLQLDERAGRLIAEWARGGKPGAPATTAGNGVLSTQERLTPSQARKVLTEAVPHGLDALAKAWASLDRESQLAMKPELEAMKTTAAGMGAQRP